jgi:ribosomal protein S27AE
MADNKIKLLIVKCGNCGEYCTEIWEHLDSQVDCYKCGYANDLSDIRTKYWETEIEDYATPEEL